MLDEFFEMAKLCDSCIIKVRQAFQGNLMIITIVYSDKRQSYQKQRPPVFRAGG